MNRFPTSPVSLAVRNPKGALGYLSLSRRFRKFFGVNASDFQSWRQDLLEVECLPEKIRLTWEERTGTPLRDAVAGTIGPLNEILYYIVRALRPSVVVETGVAYGFSTAYILQGLALNGTGVCNSIDLPTTRPEGRVNADGRRDHAHVASAQDTGLVIPPHLRSHWNLILGDSRKELSLLIGKLGAIDIFFHDSDHSYENMTWEFETAWPAIRPGGVLASDDINWNNAFSDFQKSVGGARAFFWSNRGSIRRLNPPSSEPSPLLAPPR
jgi:hypothetical protein